MLKGGKVKYNIKGLKIEGILTFPLTFRQVVNFFLRRRPYFALMFLFFDIDHSITPEKAQFSLSLKGTRYPHQASFSKARQLSKYQQSS
jgi:hypothetical protein